MNESRLSMIALNRNQFHLIVKRFLARKHQMRFMPLRQLHSGRKKGGEFYLAHHHGKINPTLFSDLLKETSFVRPANP
jgi:hypothetical protein